jgi:hypothetical protein
MCRCADWKKYLNMTAPKFTCPCCGYKTLLEEGDGTFEICKVCFWEVDGVQSDDPDYEGGANTVSLRMAQKNFIEFGACDKRSIASVRPPESDEPRDENWKPLEQN